MNAHQAAIELSTLTAEIIRRMGAAYGSAEDWRRDITRAVKVTESLLTNKANDESGNGNATR